MLSHSKLIFFYFPILRIIGFSFWTLAVPQQYVLLVLPLTIGFGISPPSLLILFRLFILPPPSPVPLQSGDIAFSRFYRRLALFGLGVLQGRDTATRKGTEAEVRRAFSYLDRTW